MQDENFSPERDRLLTKCRILRKVALTYAKDQKDEYHNLLESYAKKKITAAELNNRAKQILGRRSKDRKALGHFQIHLALVRNLALVSTGRPFLRNPLEDDRDVPSPDLLMARLYLAAWSKNFVGVERLVSRLLFEAVKCFLKDLIQLSATISSIRDGRKLSPSEVRRALEEYPRFFHIQKSEPPPPFLHDLPYN